MGIIRTEIEIFNAEDIMAVRRKKLSEDEIKSVKVTVLVDSGAYMMAINETIKNQLDLLVVDKQYAELFSGSIVALDVVGPIEIRFKNRRTTTEAVVLPGNTEPLFGAIPMEAMDVMIDMKKQELIVNPAHPTRPQLSLK